jgi:hypothetical protein
MACFLAPTAAAIVTATIKRKASPTLRLDWLNAMLWGGVIMLVVDHILNGEIIFTPPFFTAGGAKILSEILRVGVPMILATVSVWLVMVLVSIRLKAGKAHSLMAS